MERTGIWILEERIEGTDGRGDDGSYLRKQADEER